jgi:hypothetical protein
VTKLFKPMKRADKEGLRERIYGARDVVSTTHTVAVPATRRRGI